MDSFDKIRKIPKNYYSNHEIVLKNIKIKLLF